ncbi:MAG: TonB-dependent receptor [Desulfurivibrionaceae bacterium]|nr:TonB-dependent receptor [Desulfurivibrionaceae bacterium]
MRRELLFLGGALLLGAVGSAHGAEGEPIKHEFEEIVVTATRSERSTREVPAAVTVVSQETIEDSRLIGVKEALEGVAGVQAESRNGGYDARLIIRGAGLKARYGVREIMVLLDGVPITDPDGFTRLDFVDTQLIEQVEVTKGPNSTLYGANAAGGVINVITKSPFEEIKSLKTGYGSDDTTLLSGVYGSHVGGLYATLSGTHKSSNGWREHNEFESDQAGIKFGTAFDDNSSLELNLNMTEAEIELPGSLSLEQFESDISQLTDGPFRHSARDSTIYYTTLKYEKPLGPVTIKPLVYYQSWEHFHPVTGGINDGGADILGADVQANFAHQLFGLNSELVSGISGQQDSMDSEKFTYRDILTSDSGRLLSTLSDEKGDLMETSDEVVNKWGLYLQETLRPGDAWLVDLGVRYDRVTFDFDSEIFQEYSYATASFVANRQTINIDETFERVSPRLGVVYAINSIYSLYGTVSTGFQTPQSSELEDNPNLTPATTVNYETGMKALFKGGHALDLALFHMQVSDEVIQTLLPGGESSYNNAGETRKNGLEFTGTYQALDGLAIGGTYTYSDFEFDEFSEPIRVYDPVTHTTSTVLLDHSGNQLPYIPEHQYSLFARYRHPQGFKCSVTTSTWGRYYVDAANSETYEGYTFLTKLMVGYEKGPWAVTLDVQNLFDDTYAMEVTKYSDEKRYRPGAPRTFFGKFTYAF